MEQRQEETRDTLMEMVKGIQSDVADIKGALFGPVSQPWMGFIPQTQSKIDKLEDRTAIIERRVFIWLGVLAVLAPVATLLVQRYILMVR